MVRTVLRAHTPHTPAAAAKQTTRTHKHAHASFVCICCAVVSFLVIKRTNVVMLKLLAISRNALVVLAGILLFADHVSRIQFCGYAISLFFFSIYNYLLVTNKG